MKIMRSLVYEFERAERKRNFLLSGIIALTVAILFVTMSLAKGRIMAENIREIRQNGSAATAVLENVSEKQWQQLLELNYISDMGEVKDFGHCYSDGRYFLNCSVVREADFWTIFSPAYEDLEGNYPQIADEVMLSLHTLSSLGIENPKIGMEIPLHIVRNDWFSSGVEDIQRNFYLSGYYRDYVAFWDKLPVAFFSEALLQEQGIALFPGNAYIVSDQIWMGRDHIEKRFYQDIDMRTDQNLWVVTEGNWGVLQNIAGGIFWVFAETLLILLSMNLLIYNIFSIGIGKYKQQCGLLKVIGATSRQVKGIFYAQGIRILLKGSIAGAFLGSIIVWLVVPELVSRMVLAGTGSAKNIKIYSWGLLGEAVCLGVLGAIVALEHCIRHIVRLSPIECLGSRDICQSSSRKHKSLKGCAIREIAWRNLFRNYKKAMLSIGVLFLSIEVSLMSAVITKGLDQTHRIEQIRDFEVGVTKDAVARYIYTGTMYNETMGHELLPRELMDSIAATTKVSNKDMLKCIGSYGVFNRQSASMAPRQRSYRNDVDIITELTIQIVPDAWIRDLEGYVKRNELNIDMHMFREADGFLLLHSHELSQPQQAKVGEVIGERLNGTIFENGGRKFELICSGYLDTTEKGVPALNMPWGGSNLNYIVLSEATAGRLGMTPYVYSVSFDVNRKEEPEIKRKLQNLLAEWNQGDSGYSSYYLTARSDILAEEQGYILAVRVVMGVFDGMLMLFAILGYSNIVIMGMVERRTEFTIMRSLGMTRKQLKKMLIWEGVFYSCCVIGLLFCFGNVILIAIGSVMSKNVLYFTYQFPMLEWLVFLVLLLCISIGIPLAVYKKQSSTADLFPHPASVPGLGGLSFRGGAAEEETAQGFPVKGEQGPEIAEAAEGGGGGNGKKNK